jgi:hypothetical protein
MHCTSAGRAHLEQPQLVGDLVERGAEVLCRGAQHASRCSTSASAAAEEGRRLACSSQTGWQGWHYAAKNAFGGWAPWAACSPAHMIHLS